MDPLDEAQLLDDVHAAVVHAVREQGVDVALLLADTMEALADLVFFDADADPDPDRDAEIAVLRRQAATVQAIGINLGTER